MDEKSRKQMARMVDAVQPHCDEQIVAAMTCSHSGSMGSALVGSILGGLGGGSSSCDLPNPVFIAVGPESIYAFDYKPRGFKFKIKKEVARWPRAEMSIDVEETGRMCYFTMTTSGGESYAMEVPTVMSGKDLVALFIAALKG